MITKNPMQLKAYIKGTRSGSGLHICIIPVNRHEHH